MIDVKKIGSLMQEKVFNHSKNTLVKAVSLLVMMVILLEAVFSVSILTADAVTTYFTVRINYLYTNGSPIHDPYMATYSINDQPEDYVVTNPIIDGFDPMKLDNDNNDPEELPTGGSSAETTSVEFNGIYGDKTYNVYYVPGLTHYAARYYLQNIYDDLYTLDRPRTEANTNRLGETGSTPDDLEAEEITGFTSLFHEPDAIAADGSTVFRVYYDRNYYTVNFDLGEGGYGVEPVYAKYESVYRVDEPNRMGYTFLGWARTDKDSSINTYDETGEDEDGWHYIDASGNIITKENATAVQNLVQLEGNQTVPAENTYYKAIWSAGTSSLSVVFWVENANSELTNTAADFIKPNGDPMTEDEIRAKISENYSALCIRDIYNIKRNGTYTPVVSGMTIDANTIVRTRAFRAVQEGVVSSDSEAREIAITDLFSYSLGYADPANPFNEDPDPTDPNYDPDAIVYKKDPDGHIIDFNDISEGTSKELNGAGDFFEMNTSANSYEPLLISDTEITVRGDGTSRFNVFYRRKTFTMKFYYARQGYTNGVLDPNKFSLTNSTKQFNDKSSEKEYLKTTSKNVLEAIAMGSWKQNLADSLPTVKDEYKQLVTEGYDDFTDSHYNGYYRYYYYQLQAKYNEPLTNKWLIDALNTVHRKGAGEAEICYPGSIATEYYNQYYQDRKTSGNFTVKGIYEKLDKGILFTDSARATMKQLGIDYTELHFLISWTNSSDTDKWNNSITRVLHFRYENYVELLPREVEIVENNGTQALINEGNYTDVRQFTTKVDENGSWVEKTKWYGLSTDHVYETIDSGDQYDRSKSLADRNNAVYQNQTPTSMTGFELEYYRTNSGLITLDNYNTEIDWSQDTNNYRRCIIKFFYRRREYTLQYRNGNREDESHTRTVMYGAPLNSQYIVAEDGHEAGDYRYYWPDPEYFDENRRDFFTFDGWYNDPRYDNAFDLATQTMPADDDTLFAKWSPKNINVVFYNTYDDYYIDRKDQHSEKKIVLNQHDIDVAEANEETPPDELRVLPVDYGSYVPLSKIPINDDSEDNPRPRLTPIAEGASFAGWYYIRNRVPVRFEPENVPVTPMNQESMGDNGTLRLFAEWVTKDVAKYKISYVKDSDPNTEVASPTIGRAYVWKTKTFNAKSGDELYDEYKWSAEGEDEGNNWWPTTNSSSLVVKANNQGSEFAPNELTFTYIQKDKVSYKVQYLDATTRLPINPEKQDIIKQSSHASVSEDAIIIPGYVVENASQSIVLTASSNPDPDEQLAEELDYNVITFLYRENTTEYLYQVDYLTEDFDGVGYSIYSSETLTVPIAAQGDTTVAISDLQSRPMPIELQNTGYILKANSTTYTVTNAAGVTDPTEIPVSDNGSVVIVDNDKKTIKIYFDRKSYSYVYYYIDHTAEKAYNEATPAKQASMWDGVIETHAEASNVAPVGQEITLNVPTDIAHVENPVTHEFYDYTRLTNTDGTLNEVNLTIQPDDNNVGMNVIKVYYRKDIERELNYKMICVNDSDDTDYYDDASHTPKFGRLTLSIQTVQNYDDIQNVTFYDNNNETDEYNNYLHLHHYTFLGWYTTPTYDPEHPEVGRLTGSDDPTLSKDELDTGGDLPSKDTKYYALVKQDMVTMDVMFYYTDDYTVDEFKAVENDDFLATGIQQAVNNKDNASVPDNQKIHPDGEHVGKEVTFTAPNGYVNHTEIPWHRNDGYTLSMTDIDNRVYKYQFAEWWEVDGTNNNALIRHENWNSAAEWDPDSLSQQLSRNRNQYLIAVYARRDDITALPYTINYNFKDRFDNERTYVEKGVLSGNQLDESSEYCAITDDGDYRLNDEFILLNAPYESNHGSTLRWSNSAEGQIIKTSEKAQDAVPETLDPDTGAVIDDGIPAKPNHLTVNITAIQNTKTVYAHYRTTPTGAYTGEIETTYGANYKTDEQMKDIEAPETYDGKAFSYWEVRKSDDANAKVIAKSYDTLFDLCMMDNYWISPCYEGAAEGPGSNTVVLVNNLPSSGGEDWLAWTWNAGEEGIWVRADSNMTFHGLKDYVLFARAPEGMALSNINWTTKEGLWNWSTLDIAVQDGGTYILTGYGQLYDGDKALLGDWASGSTDPEPESGEPEGSTETTTGSPSITLTPLDNSRNRWTDENDEIPADGSTDLLFTDFEIAFLDNGEKIKGDETYQCGVVFEACARFKATSTFDPNNDYGYVSDPDALKAAIAAQNSIYTTQNKEGSTKQTNRNLLYSQIDVDNLTNKDRIQLGHCFPNNCVVSNGNDGSQTRDYSKSNSRYLMKATAYMIKDNQVILSNSVYVCLKAESEKEWAVGFNLIENINVTPSGN